MKKYVLLIIISTAIILSTQAQKLLPTKLTITVLDRQGNVVEGASVSLYLTQDDYQNNANIQQKGITNNKGIVKFTNLQSKPYYIDCVKEDLNNNGEGVMTDPLQNGKINKVFVVIE